MFYAEMTRDMQGMFIEKDENFVKKSLFLPIAVDNEESKDGSGAPEIKAALSDDEDDLLAGFIDTKAKNKKKGKGKGKQAPKRSE